MPRNISFALTTDQIRQQTKTVTRRKGWKFLKAGDVLNACVKCMGLKPRQPIMDIAPTKAGWYDVQWDRLLSEWQTIWLFEGGQTWGRSPDDDPESLSLDGEPFMLAIPGEKIERLGQIYVKDVRRESLAALYFDLAYGKSECDKEGFPEMTGPEFISMFCAHMGGLRDQEVTRIEFGYLPVMECTDQLNCLCAECESARVVNLRTTLIRCVGEGEMNATMRDAAKAAITHSYGSDRWLRVWGIDG